MVKWCFVKYLIVFGFIGIIKIFLDKMILVDGEVLYGIIVSIFKIIILVF